MARIWGGPTVARAAYLTDKSEVKEYALREDGAVFVRTYPSCWYILPEEVSNEGEFYSLVERMAERDRAVQVSGQLVSRGRGAAARLYRKVK